MDNNKKFVLSIYPAARCISSIDKYSFHGIWTGTQYLAIDASDLATEESAWQKAAECLHRQALKKLES